MNESEKCSEDRLSDLPDSLIFELFWLLPMRDVVRTTLLSKRWENLWTRTPYLNFNGNHKPEFVDRALTLWKGLKVLKFKKRSRFHTDGDDSWVPLVKVVEELYIENIGTLYCVPQNLFSCSSLKVLSLSRCKLLQMDGNGNVQWNQLKSLTIERCVIDDEDLINKVVCVNPQLEVLVLNHDKKNLSIRSSSLKKLSIQRNITISEPSSTELRICAPNLETLDLSFGTLDFARVPYEKYSLENVSSLTHLALDLYVIDGFFDQIVVDLLQFLPQLNTLVLRGHLYSPWYSRSCVIKHAKTTSLLQLERNLPESFLLQLRTIEITLVEEDEELIRFIGILLKHASNLQKMVFRVKVVFSTSYLCWAFKQKVERLPRSSQTAELIFAEF